MVTALDEAELMRQMERAAAENEEVAGDDDEDDEGQVYMEGENGHKLEEPNNLHENKEEGSEDDHDE